MIKLDMFVVGNFSHFEIGFIVIWLGILMIFIGFLLFARKGVKSGGVILIGPFPIVWGSDVGLVKWIIIITIILVVVYFLFFLTFFSGFR